MDNIRGTIRELNQSVSQSASNDDSLTVTNILHIVIGIIGVFCNVMICMVVFKFAPSKTSRVNLFILNQAIVDLIASLLMILFGIALDPSTYKGVLGVLLCLFWAPGSDPLLFFCFAISTYNLTVMSVERYIAVLHPVQYRRIFKRKTCILIIVVVWIVAPLAEYMFPILKNTVEDNICTIKSTWTPTTAAIVGVFVFTWEFLIPCCIMSFAYLKIIKKLRDKALAVRPTTVTVDGPNSSYQAQRSIKARKNVIYTFFCLFIIYVVCWAPNQITFVQFNLGGHLDVKGTWFNFTVIWAFINTFTSTFVFVFRHKQFQRGLRKLGHCRWTETGQEETVMTEAN